jgi:hypothetical protein
VSQACSCGGKGRCLETRPTKRGTRRRYECLKCEARWNTIEIPAASHQGRKVAPTHDAEVADSLRLVAAQIDKLIVRFS